MEETDKVVPVPLQEETLPTKKSRNRKKHFYNTILQQMEFYFSDSNLTKDRFLSQLLSENTEIDIETFLKFNKIRKINCTIEDIQKALSKSELIGLSEDGKKLHRKIPISIKENVDLCTIYVEHIRTDATHESLIQIFSDFGKVVYVSIPKYKHNKNNKGFAFIEYETEEQAQAAIAYFDSIGMKIPTAKGPEELQSILTFEGEQQELFVEEEEGKINTDVTKEEEEKINTVTKQEKIDTVVEEKNTTSKRKLSIEEPDKETKKQKLTDETVEESETSKRKLDSSPEETDSKKLKLETTEVKKKKHKKKDKRKNYFKELGMQVLSKKEWKRLRNQYLQLQRKKMKEFKQYLYKQKYGPKEFEEEPIIAEPIKLNYIPGVIVKLKLLEPCNDVKKLKTEVKTTFTEAKYVDVPLPAGSEEVFIRFNTAEAANEFKDADFEGEKVVLAGEEERIYWEKIETDRTVKFKKTAKKQRGRDKLLKRAERESTKHMRFEDEALDLDI
ncbi:unnamed protein product [Ceutorhynchus assimilis]|uniref:La-related protein 7 n=1 Tax=Ceutorhynchus assimilis TaxID=467358 RepID=A0A9N9MIR1_9CUCU|nr:unnamed protein product [Ceutorhynchus assimilis]